MTAFWKSFLMNLFCYSLLIIGGSLLPRGQAEDLVLVNNEYKGLVVSISDHVPQEHCSQLIHGLKNVMREFSSVLWMTTGGRASIHDVTVALPRSWKIEDLSCSEIMPLSIAAKPTSGHLHITASHPVFGSRPWAQQSQGCGRRGDYIQMGSDILKASFNNTYSKVAHLLMAEWAKYRWGVFEERGYPNDVLYPTTFRDPRTMRFRPNSCNSHNAMALPFCSDAMHVPEAPTKHNAQCIGRPAWDIIHQSQDFIYGRDSPSNVTAPYMPSLNFIQESPPRFVLVVEDTAVMGLQQRWEFVRKAVRRVMVYDVPDGSYVALVIFNSVAKTTAPLMKMESLSDVRQRVGSSLPRNPSTVPESLKCVLCGLQEALRALEGDPLRASGATIILLTTGNGIDNRREVDEMMQLARLHKIRVNTIIYPFIEQKGFLNKGTSLQSLVSSTGGSSFTVMDEGVGNDSKVNMMVALMEALFSAVRQSSPIVFPGGPVLVHSQSYSGGISEMASGSFNLDDSFDPDVRFSIFYYDLNHVGNTVELTSPSGHMIESVNLQEDGDANVIFVNIPQAERGLWQYHVENRADSHQGLHIQVAATESHTRKIGLRVWISHKDNAINMTDPSAPVIIYAELKDDLVPILNARLTARIKRLGANTTGSMVFNLFDNGFGDPDITAGDGVYSRYLPILHGGPGNYELSVKADHNNGQALSPSKDAFTRSLRTHNSDITCCGSIIAYEYIKPIASFQRSAIYGVLNVVSPPPEIDIVPPTRILDLRSVVNLTTREVTLHWTSPGDDYDWDQAHHYEAVLASSWLEAKAFEGERIKDMPTPVLVGTEQFVKVQVDQYDQLIYVAIRGVDEAGNRGGVSNIASIMVPEPLTTPAIIIITRTQAPAINQSKPLGREVTQPVRVSGLSVQDMGIIIGSIGAFLIIVAIIATYCYCHVSHQHTHQHKEETEKNEGNPNILIKSNSTLMMDQDNSQESVNSTEKEEKVLISRDDRPLSPMQSWAASKLLQEHERHISVSIGPSMEASGSTSTYLQEPFPDVTLTNIFPYPSSQTPSTTHSDPPAYQPSYSGEEYVQCPYPYPEYSQEELPPYTPPAFPAHSSPPPAAYTQEIISQTFEMSHQSEPNNTQADIPSTIPKIPYCQSNLPVNVICSSEGSYPTHETLHMKGTPSKVPPPVAPKPSPSVRTVSLGSPMGSGEPKRRNVTQV
ncbi:calcium-activated chloride channel regulator 4-like [Macrobrachium rosenbergii]|uniref:calcium-activated chloride channel regulator 4-like n=1 Tax=Macrobrachium rosenbergii TaxID=79674 RepID=UPI0034D45DDD